MSLSLCSLQNRMESHVRNVELFHRLMQIQVDWLSDAETRLFTLRRPSRLVNCAQQQLDAHRVIKVTLMNSFVPYIFIFYSSEADSQY
jgi:hypothetical protein